MLTVFIGGLAVRLAPRFAEGDIIDETAAVVLTRVWTARLAQRLRWLQSRGELDWPSMQAKADELALQPLGPPALSDTLSGDNDPVLQEAMTMAREIINAHMAQENLPVPKAIDEHARALLDGMPHLIERARARVEARYEVANAALGLDLS